MTRERRMPEGAKLSQEWIAVGDLTLETPYQRDLSEAKIRRIRREFDPDMLGSLTVSRRDDGTIVIVDGQHRREVVQREWGDREQVPCLVYHGLTIEAEAAIWRGMNRERTTPRPLEMFRAALIEGRPETVDIDRIVRRRGFRVGSGTGRRMLQAVVAIERTYRLAGPDILDETLDILSKSGVASDESIPGEIIPAIALLLVRHGARLDRKRLVVTLQKYPPRRLLGQARMLSIDGYKAAAGMSLVLARVLLRSYNSGLRRANARIEWVDTADTKTWLPIEEPTA